MHQTLSLPIRFGLLLAILLIASLAITGLTWQLLPAAAWIAALLCLAGSLAVGYLLTNRWLATERREDDRRVELRVAERTAALQEAAAILSDQTIRHQIVSEAAEQISALLDLDDLLARILRMIQERFGVAYAAVWTVEGTEAPRLLAGRNRLGEMVLPQGFAYTNPGGALASAIQSGHSASTLHAETQRLGAINGIYSEAAAPLRLGDETLGALHILQDEPQEFESPDVDLLQSLASQLAIAMRNARLYEAEQQRRQSAELLQQAGQAISGSLDLREVTGKILEQLQAVVPYERGSMMLEQDNALLVVAQRGFPSEERTQRLRIPIRSGDVYEQVTQAGKPVLINDVTQEAGWQQVDWLPLNRSWLGTPLIVHERNIGMLSLTRVDASAFTDEDATLVLAFAAQAAIALDNARLYDEVYRTSRALERAYHNLERLDRAKADFIEVAAHELRTPLTVIKGYLQVFATRPGVSQDQDTRPLINHVMDGVNRLHDVINNMLDVSKIDSQTLRTHLAPTWIHMVIKRIQAELQPVLDERKLVFYANGLDVLPYLQADSELLFKAFYHLVVNAIKFTPDGGRIEVRGRSVLDDRDRTAVEISIQDTGIGIDAAELELIFEKFYQTGKVSLHSSGKTKFKGGGPGLGLAIARGIIHAHHGRVWADSPGYDENELPGSTFFVRLPLSQDDLPPAAEGKEVR